jgi:uncharacterized repeat protein (TIGR01451 family)
MSLSSLKQPSTDHLEITMRTSKFITAIFLAIPLGCLSLGVSAAEGAIKIASTAQIELELLNKDGTKSYLRQPVEKAVPGTEIIFTNAFENTSAKAANDIVINNPIPGSTTYKAGSAFGEDCDIQFSVDGGKKFSHAEELKIIDVEGNARPALPKEYTHIRWLYKKPLPAGKTSEVGFRATIN